MEASRIGEVSPRGRDCLWGVHRGLTSKEIARELGIAEGTVTGYIRDAVVALGAPNRRAAARALFGDPNNLGGQSLGLVAPPNAAPSEPGSGAASPWWGFLDVANRGVTNDLGIFARIGIVLFLTVGLASGFGALAAAVRVLSDLVAGIGRGG